ncbi:MAG: methylenetetrahydrofolate--tRNA-(uracil(54)-C(5))-methyltransferase (FADH(2)-oxidizing) TrmFO [Ruminococcaceae bacterium]|nr:methylenetetrahydrofolate--tRNA-(uracil(54)-C(5))-methyltransferase (FADH(2)-oxidizing) TrmFO [Oscillospiraceae bacterium]
MNKPKVTVLGAGLAGCEAAWQCAERGVAVQLWEMKPVKFTPAHHDPRFAELCCSNSLRSDALSNAVGLLKEEMRRAGSLLMEAADRTRVPAGSALAVDRAKFAGYVTEKVKNHPLIEVVEKEADAIPEGVCVVATGPLSSEPMAQAIAALTGKDGLYFYDAVAPIVDFSTIDMDVAFFASRYDKGDADYINCPMTREQYDAFYQALVSAKEAELHDFDKEGQKSPKVFEGCMPVEVMARRGYDTLRYGPLKPVGLVDRRTGKESFAVVQLRKENKEGTMYNLVGFQTHLTFPEQKRVFSLIPGLENATFLRYGVMHRNTYLHSPGFLDNTYATLSRPDLFFAGQMTGVEGYIESAGSGLVAGINAARMARNMSSFAFPAHTMLGAMANYVANGGIGDFVPMNANFGIVERLSYKVRGGKAARNEAISARALEALEAVLQEAKK